MYILIEKRTASGKLWLAILCPCGKHVFKFHYCITCNKPFPKFLVEKRQWLNSVFYDPDYEDYPSIEPREKVSETAERTRL